jgi:hypothetical protein
MFSTSRPRSAREHSAGDELLPAVDIVGRRAGECGVDHEMHRQRGDVGGSDDAADREGGAELLAAGFELIAEERSLRPQSCSASTCACVLPYG